MEGDAPRVAAAVECHSGYTYGERPVAFTLEGRRHIVSSIEDRRRLPDRLVFRVRTPEGGLFDLVYILHRDEWLIQQP